MASKVFLRTSVAVGLVGIFTACGLSNSPTSATDNRSTTGTTTSAAAPTANVSSTSADATTAGGVAAPQEQAPTAPAATPVSSPVADAATTVQVATPPAAATTAATTTETSPTTATTAATGTMAAPADTKDVDFHIVAGTAKAEWNTAATPVKLKVGQVLHVYNDDTIAHRMHTFGTPCPHGQDIAPGAMATCTIAAPIDTVAKPGLLYDHDYGTAALFYMQATAN